MVSVEEVDGLERQPVPRQPPVLLIMIIIRSVSLLLLELSPPTEGHPGEYHSKNSVLISFFNLVSLSYFEHIF